MSGTGDRLHDVRQRPTFQVEKAAIAYIPTVGPAAWAVYCFLISLTAEGDTRWPDVLSVASACGISTYNAQLSIDTLLDAGLVVRHQWTTGAGAAASFAIIPVGTPPSETEADVDMPEIQPQDTDLLVSEDTTEEERWRAETEERNQTRELFSRMLDALGVNPADLSDQARSTATEASRLARAAGASVDDVNEMIDRIREAQPDLVDDAERMLEYWSNLFDEMSREQNGDPESG
ncbi:MAG: hypothetical protein R3A46_19805 [Thermomicrobiales bacterium]